MTLLIAGLILFMGVHVVPMQPALRASLKSQLGQGGYMAMFAAGSVIGLALIVYGYGQMQGSARLNPELWTPPTFMRHISLLLMLPAMILLVAAYVPSTIRTVVGHPMLAAIKIWAFSHLIANGDLASVLLFGSFLVFAVVDRISVKRRIDGSGLGPLGVRQGATSGDIIAIVVGIGLYAALLLGAHAYLFGVAPVPKWSLA